MMQKTQMSSPKVSILVPCYNVEKYLKQCISSLLQQSLIDIEIICINDGSTDSTLKILKSFEDIDHRVIVIDKQNSGYGDSMNCGLEIARGEFVGIVESDDFVEPNMFESLYTVAKSFNVQIARCCYFEYEAGKDTPVKNEWVPKGRVHNPNVEQAAFYQAPAIWSAIYQRTWLNDSKIRFLPTPGASYQDTSFAFKCYACCDRFIMIEVALLHYRIDNQNNSVNNPGKVFCVCDEWNEIYRFVRQNKQKFGHLLSIMPSLQYGTYKWNLKRIKGFYKLQFLLKWFGEICIHFTYGELSLSQIWLPLKKKLKALF